MKVNGEETVFPLEPVPCEGHSGGGDGALELAFPAIDDLFKAQRAADAKAAAAAKAAEARAAAAALDVQARKAEATAAAIAAAKVGQPPRPSPRLSR